MPEAPTAEVLFAAASEVLETMFFTPVMGETVADAQAPVGSLAARLRFSGGCSGTFAVRVSLEGANCIAANFLGEEASEPTPGQVRDVIGELTNMVCGSVLSRLDAEAHFDLGHPEVVEPAEAATPGANGRAFDIGDGEVAVFLHLDVQP